MILHRVPTVRAAMPAPTKPIGQKWTTSGQELGVTGKPEHPSPAAANNRPSALRSWPQVVRVRTRNGKSGKPFLCPTERCTDFGWDKRGHDGHDRTTNAVYLSPRDSETPDSDDMHPGAQQTWPGTHVESIGVDLTALRQAEY